MKQGLDLIGLWLPLENVISGAIPYNKVQNGAREIVYFIIVGNYHSHQLKLLKDFYCISHIVGLLTIKSRQIDDKQFSQNMLTVCVNQNGSLITTSD